MSRRKYTPGHWIRSAAWYARGPRLADRGAERADVQHPTAVCHERVTFALRARVEHGDGLHHVGVETLITSPVRGDTG